MLYNGNKLMFMPWNIFMKNIKGDPYFHRLYTQMYRHIYTIIYSHVCYVLLELLHNIILPPTRQMHNINLLFCTHNNMIPFCHATRKCFRCTCKIVSFFSLLSEGTIELTFISCTHISYIFSLVFCCTIVPYIIPHQKCLCNRVENSV